MSYFNRNKLVMPKLPFVIMININYTIVGNMQHCMKEQELLELLFSNCKEKKITSKCSNNALNIENELKKGLLRPYFKDFVDFCNEKYGNVELFVYAPRANYTRINKVLVPNIEKASGVKFNKPYFTREFASLGTKNRIAFAYEDILETLKNKYPSLSKSKKHQENVLANRLMLINWEENTDELSSKQIICPEYSYYCYYDIVRKLIYQYGIDESRINVPNILEFCSSVDIPYYTSNGNNFQKDELYINAKHTFLLNLTRVTNSEKDTFFKDLIQIMKNKKQINDKSIKNINKIIMKTHKSKTDV